MKTAPRDPRRPVVRPIASVVCAVAFWAGHSLAANGIAVGAELVQSRTTYELESMQNLDKTVTDDWTKSTTSATKKGATSWNEEPNYPVLLSLFYEHKIGKNVLLAGVRHITDEPRFTYTFGKKSTGLSFVENVEAQFQEKLTDYELALRIPFTSNFSVTPRFGLKTEKFKARHTGYGIGNDTAHASEIVSTASLILQKGDLQGPYAGATIMYDFTKTVSAFAGAARVRMTGNKSEQEYEAESSPSTQITVGEYIRTDAKMRGSIYQFGLLYKVSRSLHLHVGYAYETFKVSYPNFWNTARFSTSGTAVTIELPSHHDVITDFLIYGSEKRRTKRHIALGLVYELHLSK